MHLTSADPSWNIFQLTDIHNSYKIIQYCIRKLLTLVVEPPITLSTIWHISEKVLSIHHVTIYTTI